MLENLLIASHVVRQLLQLARLDSRAQSEPSAVDLAQVVQEKLMQSAPPALSKQIELLLSAPESLPLNINVLMFRFILDNLLDNALRYVPAGGRVQVYLSAATQLGGGIRLGAGLEGRGCGFDVRIPLARQVSGKPA